MTFFFDSTVRSADPWVMKTAILIGIIIGAIGCGGEQEDPCEVPSTSSVSYGDCKSQLPDGTEAVVYCGQLPDNGESGTVLPVGCKVQIGTSTPDTATCLEVCP